MELLNLPLFYNFTEYPLPGYKYPQSIGIQDERNQRRSLARLHSCGPRLHVHRDRGGHGRGHPRVGQHNPSSAHYHTPGTFQLGDPGTSL